MKEGTIHENIEKQIFQIKAYLDGKLSQEEKVEFERWIERDLTHQRLMERIKNERVLAGKIRFCERNNREEGWKYIQKRIHHSFLFRRIIRYAAVAVVSISVGAAIVFWNNTRPDTKQESCVVQQESPSLQGGAKVYLELASGEHFVLDSTKCIQTQIDGVVIKTDKVGSLVVDVQEKGSTGNEVEYNRIVVPKTGEYHLVLADGSQVWVNSHSVIEFPTRFTNKERRVKILSGEAYFEVEKDPGHPFIVEVQNKEVRVLGTSFHINCYEEKFATTLVTGKVEVALENKTYLLTPSMQISITDDSVSLAKVNVREFLAWKDGWFVFKNRRLEEVLIILSRWYNIEIFYQKEELKNLHFTGSIQRHSDVEELLQFLQKTGSVRFSLDGQTLIVSE